MPILQKAVKDGNAEPWHYAFLTDRVRLNKGEKQVYGTQSISGKTPYIVPLEDPDHVDSLRRELGLEPIADYAASLGIPWNLEQYKKDLPLYCRLYEKWSASRKEDK